MAVYTEALRLHPVAPFTSRTCAHDVELCGHTVPAGSVVFTNFWAVHTDESLYPDALAFNPERWMPDPAAAVAAAKDRYFAFSVGPQSCIGA